MNCLNFTDMSGCYEEFAAGGMVGAILLAGIAIFLLVVLATYVYSSFAWMTIAKKLKYKKAWLAWIPIANISMLLQLGKFHWAWVFLILIPILGWIALLVLIIIATWRVFEKRKYPGWLSLIIPLGMIIPRVDGIAIIGYFIIIGFVAWKNQR
jgi:hypothetical protein